MGNGLSACKINLEMIWNKLMMLQTIHSDYEDELDDSTDDEEDDDAMIDNN